jgi:hypothetical protein
MGLCGVVLADLDNSSSKMPEFIDPSGVPMFFDYEETGSDQASLGSCAMNPMAGNSVNDAIMENQQVDPEPPLVSFVEDAQPLLRSEMAPRSSRVRTDPNYPLSPPPNFPEPPNPTTPEPATLLIIGMSVVGLVPLVKRYRRRS